MSFSFSVAASAITQTGSRARGPGGRTCPIPAAIPFPQGAEREAIETCGSPRWAVDRVHSFFQRCFFHGFVHVSSVLKKYFLQEFLLEENVFKRDIPGNQ